MSFSITTTIVVLLLSSVTALTNVEEIKCLDNNITMLMDKALTREDVTCMQKYISFYTGEMAGVVWRMVEPLQPKELWDVAREIYVHGKPRFIDYRFSVERYVRMFQWTLDEITFCSDLRADANTVWTQFVEVYREKKNKRHHTIDETTIVDIEEVHL